MHTMTHAGPADPLLFVALLSTTHFDFAAAGYTEDHARDTLAAAWNLHATETDATYTWEQLSEDVTILAFRPGVALRDGSQFYPTRIY